jgi:hypothetical protein
VGAGLSLEELAMPDLDLIKQGEQACDPPEATNTSSTGCFNKEPLLDLQLDRPG